MFVLFGPLGVWPPCFWRQKRWKVVKHVHMMHLNPAGATVVLLIVSLCSEFCTPPFERRFIRVSFMLPLSFHSVTFVREEAVTRSWLWSLRGCCSLELEQIFLLVKKNLLCFVFFFLFRLCWRAIRLMTFIKATRSAKKQTKGRSEQLLKAALWHLEFGESDK